MRLPRVRFTVRRMMVCVAIVAILLGTAIWTARLRRRAAHYRALAASWAAQERGQNNSVVVFARILKEHELRLSQAREDARIHSPPSRRVDSPMPMISNGRVERPR